MKWLCSLLILGAVHSSYSQLPDRPNLYNADGERTGEWVVLYDSTYEQVVTSIDSAEYYCLIDFEKGKPIGQCECFYMEGIMQWRGRLLEVEPEVKHGRATFYHPNGNVKEQVTYDYDSLVDGFRQYYENGMLAIIGQFDNNKPTGFWEYYYDNGQLQTSGVYENGLETGIWDLYYESGQLKGSGRYLENKQIGEWEYYHENGNLKAKGKYNDQGKREGEWNFYYDNGNREEQTVYKDGYVDGPIILYHPNGRILEKGNRRKGKAYGLTENYYENGQLNSLGSLTDGLYEGEWVFYYENGNKKSEGLFKDDKKYGEWQFYTEDGTLSQKGMLEADKWHGKAEFYHPNGKLSARGMYHQDQKDGEWHYFNVQGERTGITTYQKGVRHGPFEYYSTTDIILLQKGQFVNEKKTGEWIFNYDDGTPKTRGNYKDDYGHGYFHHYYENGKLSSEGAYSNGLRTENWIFYFENGNKKSEGEYESGNKVGDWVYYHANGQLYATGKYENGETVGEWKYYHENGVLKKIGKEKADLAYGRWYFYDRKGRKSQIGHFKNSESHGPWTFLDSLGNITEEARYHRDKKLDFSTYYDSAYNESYRGHYKAARSLYRKASKNFKEQYERGSVKKADLYSLRASLFRHQKKYSKALRQLDKGLNHILKHLDDTSSWYTDFLSDKGHILYDQQQYKKATDVYAKSLALISQRKHGQSSDEYFSVFADMTNSIDESGDTKRALELLSKEQDRLIATGEYPRKIARNYIALIDYSEDLDSNEYAMQAANNLELHLENQDLRDHWSYGELFYRKGTIFRNLAIEDSAHHNYLKAIDIYTNQKDTLNQSMLHALISVADYFYARSKEDKAYAYISRAIRVAENSRIDNSWIYRETFRSYGNIMLWQGYSEEAEESFSKYIDLEKAMPDIDVYNLNKGYSGRAMSFKAQGPDHYEQADENFRLAIAAIPRDIYSSYTSNAMQLYAEFLRTEMSNYKKSYQVLKELIDYHARHGNGNKEYLARAYYSMGALQYGIGQLDSAIYYYQNTIRMLEGEEDENMFFIRNANIGIANVYEDRGLVEEGQAYNFRALEVVEQHLGKENSHYANALSAVATNFSFQGNYPAAIRYFEEDIEIREILYTRNSIGYLATLVTLAEKYVLHGDLEKSLEMLATARASYEKNDWKKSYGYLKCLDIQSWVLVRAGQVFEAEDGYNELRKWTGRMYESNHRNYAKFIREIGLFYRKQSQYELALQYLSEALQSVQKAMGKNTRYAFYASDLAQAYLGLHNYPRAIELQNEALGIIEDKLGLNEDYIDELLNLVRMHVKTGRFNEGIESCQTLLELVKKEYGSFSNYSAIIHMEMANVYWKWEKPEASLQQLNIVRGLYDSLGLTQGIIDWHNMAGLIKSDLNRWEEAKGHFETAIQMTDSLLNDPVGVAVCQNNLAFYYLEKENYKKAEQLWLAGEEYFGSSNESILSRVEWMDNLAALYLAWGKMDLAEKYWTNVIDVLLERITRDFPRLSEQAKAAFWYANRNNFEYFNSYAIKAYESGNTNALEQMYNNQLRTKSILLSTSTKERKRILNSGDSVLVNTYRKYVRLKDDLARYYGYTKEQLQQENINIKKLESEAARFEKVLSMDSEALRREENTNKLHWKSIQRELDEGEAAIEIIRFRYFDKHVTDSILYAALILTPDSRRHPEIVILPNGNDLENKYVKSYVQFIKFKLKDNISYGQFWKPIENKLQGIKRVYFSPDGVFNQINISTLLNPSGRYVGDDFDIRLLTSTRDLMLLEEESSKSDNTAFLFGYPKYDLAHEQIASIIEERGLTRSENTERALDLERFGFTELPGTKTETETINRILRNKKWQTNLFLANKALEEDLKRVNNPSVLHIATHGFFLDNLADQGGSLQLGVRSEVSRDNPLLRAGLLMTGAAQTARGEVNPGIENGIFTAYEAMNLNLQNTELVVLSACETGRGEIKNGEGVYGLQRAFQIAGAEALMMSLWKVDDNATQLLMTHFYENWINGKTKSQALKMAQNRVRKEYPHPYYWGAFVLVGN